MLGTAAPAQPEREERYVESVVVDRAAEVERERERETDRQTKTASPSVVEGVDRAAEVEAPPLRDLIRTRILHGYDFP